IAWITAAVLCLVAAAASATLRKGGAVKAA
ncbi:MAG: hypothetical protein RLZZ626_251, partial [Actinomycetota bacterium]